MSSTSQAASHGKRLRVWALALIIALVWFGPSLASKLRASANPACFNDNARQQIWPFLHYRDHRLFHDDYLGDYYLACFPTGYKALYAVLAPAIDPRTLSKIVPWVEYAIVLTLMGWMARRLGGWAAMGGVLILGLASQVYFSRMAGGLPRSFAFPLGAAIAATLVAGKPRWLAAVVVVAAAFYPVMAVVGGMCLAILLLAWPASRPAEEKPASLVSRLALLSVTALLAALLVLPAERGSQHYGRILRPADSTRYPELGPAGRYLPEDRPPAAFPKGNVDGYLCAIFAGVGRRSASQMFFEQEGHHARDVVALIVICLGVWGFSGVALRDPAAGRLLVLPISAAIGQIISTPLMPYLYLPQRYTLYTFPIVTAVIVAVGAAMLPLRFARKGGRDDSATIIGDGIGPAAWQSALSVALICGVYCIFFVGSGGREVGMYRYDATHAALYSKAEFPADAMIAGWPRDLDDIPYVTARRALITREMHQAFHQEYADEMRRRMQAVIDATYGANATALLRLRDEFGVTHFIADSDLYGPTPPHYFAPFDPEIERQWRLAREREPYILRLSHRTDVLHVGQFSVIPLKDLP